MKAAEKASMCSSRSNERFVRHTLVGLLWAVAAMTCVAQSPEQDYRTRARDLFLDVERTARLRTTQQDQETARVYRDVWPDIAVDPGGLLVLLRSSQARRALHV